ncbi:MAG: urea ABC transporter ATP-binding protein UrtD [Deinococcales bacterium]
MSETLLCLEQITVSFDGFKAIENLSLSIQKGTIRVLIGPNGAGKSTMCDAVIGKVRPVSGQILFKGIDIVRKSEHEIANLGICRKFQTPGVLENLSVIDNLAVAVRKNKKWYSNLKPQLETTEQQRIQELLSLIGLVERGTILAGQLAHGEKQWLEIGMVVAANPELLLLDEPTAGMTAQETAKTAELIQKLSGQHTILVIDHDMHFVELLQAPVSVLHQGQLFAEGSIEEIRENPKVVEIYLGRAKGEPEPHARA